jgi:Clp protease
LTHSGQPLKRIEKDTDRDFFMHAAQAVEYGLIDEVIANRASKAGGDHPKPNEHPKFHSLAVGGTPFVVQVLPRT